MHQEALEETTAFERRRSLWGSLPLIGRLLERIGKIVEEDGERI